MKGSELLGPKRKLYRDTVHGFTAESLSKTGAWMLIRNACYEKNLSVPTMDKIIEIKN